MFEARSRRRLMTHAVIAMASLAGLSTTLPARADLVIQGRAAQALHCSAMLYMVSDELYRAGYISGAVIPVDGGLGMGH